MAVIWPNSIRPGLKWRLSPVLFVVAAHKEREGVLSVAPNFLIARRKDQNFTLEEIRNFVKDSIALHKMPDELCIMVNFPGQSGGVKIKKLGKGGLAELTEQDKTRQRYHR